MIAMEADGEKVNPAVVVKLFKVVCIISLRFL
jgi:hypothetical protein